MKKTTFLTILLLFGLLSQIEADTVNNIDLRLISDKQEYYVFEPILLKLEFVNLRDEPTSFPKHCLSFNCAYRLFESPDGHHFNKRDVRPTSWDFYQDKYGLLDLVLGTRESIHRIDMISFGRPGSYTVKAGIPTNTGEYFSNAIEIKCTDWPSSDSLLSMIDRRGAKYLCIQAIDIHYRSGTRSKSFEKQATMIANSLPNHFITPYLNHALALCYTRSSGRTAPNPFLSENLTKSLIQKYPNSWLVPEWHVLLLNSYAKQKRTAEALEIADKLSANYKECSITHNPSVTRIVEKLRKGTQ